MSSKTVIMLTDMLFEKEERLIAAHHMMLNGIAIDKEYMESLIEDVVNHEYLLYDAIELTKII